MAKMGGLDDWLSCERLDFLQYGHKATPVEIAGRVGDDLMHSVVFNKLRQRNKRSFALVTRNNRTFTCKSAARRAGCVTRVNPIKMHGHDFGGPGDRHHRRSKSADTARCGSADGSAVKRPTAAQKIWQHSLPRDWCCAAFEPLNFLNCSPTIILTDFAGSVWGKVPPGWAATRRGCANEGGRHRSLASIGAAVSAGDTPKNSLKVCC